jgi:hypothetical protein
LLLFVKTECTAARWGWRCSRSCYVLHITTLFTPHILMAMLSIQDAVFVGKGSVVMECGSDLLRFVKLGGKM